MKRVITGILLSFMLITGSAQAALVSAVNDFGYLDSFQAVSTTVNTTVTLGATGPAPGPTFNLGLAPLTLLPVVPGVLAAGEVNVSQGIVADDRTLSVLDSSGFDFLHDYLFLNSPDGGVGLTATTSNILLGQIVPFAIAVITTDEFGNPLVGVEPILEINEYVAGAVLNFDILPGSNFLIRLAGTVAGIPDYTMELTVVPVPAAVWLFGTAMLGLLGLRRKSRMAAAAA